MKGSDTDDIRTHYTCAGATSTSCRTPTTGAATSTVADQYTARVEQMAAALHEDCKLEWQAIYNFGRPEGITRHDANAHYGQAHDLVRRIWPELDETRG